MALHETSTVTRIHTERGRRTRARLVAAAWRVFERDGYLEARITDISRAAKVAHGTFYTYFPSKEAIFREVIAAVQADMLAGDESDDVPPDGDGGRDGQSAIERIDASNRAYLAGYRRNAKLMGLMEQVSTFSDDFRRLRLEVRRVYHARAARSIARWQEEGIADPKLDPWYAGSALCNMVDRFAYTWLVLGEHFEEDLAAETLTRLWVQAIQLQTEAPARRRKRGRRQL